jgi:hypothetical protein
MTVNNKLVRIGCSSAAWGDSLHSVSQLLQGDQIDYLVGDYLAEVTMAILSKLKARNPEGGYVPDWADSVRPHLAKIREKNIKLITNAGGMNPFACRDAFLKMAEEAGLQFNVAVVTGDDVMPQEETVRAQVPLGMFDGRPLPKKMTSMNAYLGARPVKEALDRGADVVITGRCVDTAVVLGALMHEFDWSATDYDCLASGSLAGHIIECGCQATGGLFTDWLDVCEDWDDMGFPIVECTADGNFAVTKAANTGGLVNIGTVSEQIVYEIGDPASYLLPDVTCDFSNVQLEQTATNRVYVSGVHGRAPTDSYKICGTYVDGFKVMATYMVAGWQAGAKAKKMAEKLVQRTERLLSAQGFEPYSEVSIEVIGADDTYGKQVNYSAAREVVVKIGLRHSDPKALKLFATEFAVPAVSMAQGTTGVFGGRPQPGPVVRVHSFTYSKAAVPVHLHMDGEVLLVDCTAPDAKGAPIPETSSIPVADLSVGKYDEVPLRLLVWGRSGDKGNHANIGLISRRAEYAPYVKAQITEGFILDYFEHYFEHPEDDSAVTAFDMPGMHAINFLLQDVLGGGGSASLRYDPQAKTFAQMILDTPVKVPACWHVA